MTGRGDAAKRRGAMVEAKDRQQTDGRIAVLPGDGAGEGRRRPVVVGGGRLRRGAGPCFRLGAAGGKEVVAGRLQSRLVRDNGPHRSADRGPEIERPGE